MSENFLTNPQTSALGKSLGCVPLKKKLEKSWKKMSLMIMSLFSKLLILMRATSLTKSFFRWGKRTRKVGVVISHARARACNMKNQHENITDRA